MLIVFELKFYYLLGDMFLFFFDSLAQSVEHLTFNEEADGSNPSRVTILLLYISWPLHLTVRIHGFHPCHRGSNPLGVTKTQYITNPLFSVD